MNGPRDHQQRQRIAQEAARIMAEEAVSDFYIAKKKAVQRLGLGDQSALPNNKEIQIALEQYQRLFLTGSQPQQLKRLRAVAVEAMEFLREFKPKLVGSVLTGTAGQHSDVNLHIFADCPEDVDHYLLDSHIPFHRGQKKIRINKGEMIAYPTIRFLAGQVELEIVVLPLSAIHQIPKSPVDGKAMERANLSTVKNLIE